MIHFSNDTNFPLNISKPWVTKTAESKFTHKRALLYSIFIYDSAVILTVLIPAPDLQPIKLPSIYIFTKLMDHITGFPVRLWPH